MVKHTQSKAAAVSGSAASRAVSPGAFADSWVSRTVVLGALVLGAFLGVAAYANRYQLNTDAIAYLRIAHYWADGRWDLAVSGYWGPMISWLVVPLLKFGVAELGAGRVVMAGSAVVYSLGAWLSLRALGLAPLPALVGVGTVAASSVLWSVEYISPDLLVSGLMLAAFGLLVSGRWLARRWWAAATGVLWGLAYLTKAIALPFGLVVTFGVGLTRWLTCREERRRVVRRTLLTWGATLLVAAPWMAVLSAKYGGFTFSTTGPIAHAIGGPPDADRYHPFARTLHRPEPGRIASWEDPSTMSYRFWSPWESRAYLVHQVDLVRRNLVTVGRLLAGLDGVGLGVASLLGTMILVFVRPRRFGRARWTWAAMPLVIIAGAYAMVYVQRTDQRYFYVALPLLYALATNLARLVMRWLPWSPPRAELVVLLAVAASFLPSSLLRAKHAIGGLPNPASDVARFLAERLQRVGLSGPIVGSALVAGGRSGLYTAYLIESPWYGDSPDLPLVERLDRFAACGARLAFIERSRTPRIAGMERVDSRFQDCDALLFEPGEDPRRFPVKVLKLVSPGDGSP